MRRPHLILAIRGFAPLDADAAERERAFGWAEDINREIKDKGLALEQRYWSFTPPEYCDAVAFYGEENVARLRVLKERYNPGNAFPQAYPVLD